IIAALAAAVAGLVVIHPDVLATPEAARVLLETEDAAERSAGAPEAVMIEPLTPREREILNLLAEGLGNKEIAGRLHISEHTVKFHVSSVFAKLGVASRTEAVTEGLRRGLILL
ncbi:MAG: response regulator transcription factor, partial [Blastocatellia bacterium]